MHSEDVLMVHPNQTAWSHIMIDPLDIVHMGRENLELR